MSLVLTLQIRLGNDLMQRDEEIATALENVARRFRECHYVQSAKYSAGGGEINRGIADGNGQACGEFRLGEPNI